MKLQYLGDSRDAFKWDLLHWLVSETDPPFSKLVVIPMLTPDDEVPHDGKTPAKSFASRPEINNFLEALAKTPRTLERIVDLGALDSLCQFEVQVHEAYRSIGSGKQREAYWKSFRSEAQENTLVFADPDNGLEPKTKHAEKWLRYDEVRKILEDLPQTSALVVYQHRPQREKWQSALPRIKSQCAFPYHAFSVCESNLAFIVFTTGKETYTHLFACAKCYIKDHQGLEVKTFESL
jgi:hypothetical protein